MQLSLFNTTEHLPREIEITYWSKPYDKKGNLMQCLKKYTEITKQGSALLRYIKQNPYEYKYLKITNKMDK